MSIDWSALENFNLDNLTLAPNDPLTWAVPTPGGYDFNNVATPFTPPTAAPQPEIKPEVKPETAFDYGAWRKAQDLIDAQNAENRRVDNVLASARTFFETYGMQALWSGVEGLVRQGYNDADTISGILSRDTNYQSAYFARFPAVQRVRELNKTRQQQGLPIMAELSPASYVAMEEGYRMALVGLPKGLWGTAEDVADWIVNEVSPVEVGKRVTVAKNYINYSANATVKNQLRSIYGMTDEEMTAYVLDENRAMEYIDTEYQKRMRQATVGGAAVDSGLTISDPVRDQLAGNDTYGQSYGNTLAGMQNVAEIADTYGQLGRMSGINTTTEELVTDQFGLSGAADIANKKRKLSSQERARFSGTSAINATSLNAKPAGSV